MKYYVIVDNKIYTSDNQNALSRYYDAEIKTLPDDYNSTKYIVQDNELILNPDWSDIELNSAKEQKIFANDSARDEALNRGVTYKDVLFDSDTDQKINLLAVISRMDDEQNIIWYGKDNQPLSCSKDDLINIGGLITQLHSFCWNRNASIKASIDQAQTIADIIAIEITYESEV